MVLVLCFYYYGFLWVLGGGLWFWLFGVFGGFCMVLFLQVLKYK